MGICLYQISALFKQFCSHEPVFVIIDVRPGVVGIPTTAYQAVEEVESEGKEIQRVFKHISCAVEADEAEEVSFITVLFQHDSDVWCGRQIGRSGALAARHQRPFHQHTRLANSTEGERSAGSAGSTGGDPHIPGERG